MDNSFETDVLDEYDTSDTGAGVGEGAPPEDSLSARCQAFVEVSEAPKAKRGISQLAAGIALVVLALFCFSIWLSLPGIIFAGGGVFLIVRARKAVSGRATKGVLVEVGYATGILSILMTDARLFDGVYVDQLYTAMAEDIQAVWFDADRIFHLRASAMGSTAMRGDEVLEYRPREQTEITFQTDADGQRAVEGLLFQAGIKLGA